MRPERGQEQLRNMFRHFPGNEFRAAKGVTMVAVLPARIDEGTPSSRFTAGPAIVLYLAFAKLLLHLLTAARYGIFRDEMYSDGRGDREHFGSVQAAGRVEHPYLRRDEHFTIWLCRGLNQDLRELWPTTSSFSPLAIMADDAQTGG